MKNTIGDEIIDPLPRLERRIQLDQRIGPKNAVPKGAVDDVGDARLANRDKTTHVRAVVIDQAAAVAEDIHARFLAAKRRETTLTPRSRRRFRPTSGTPFLGESEWSGRLPLMTKIWRSDPESCGTRSRLWRVEGADHQH